jgi:signal peptidase I
VRWLRDRSHASESGGSPVSGARAGSTDELTTGRRAKRARRGNSLFGSLVEVVGIVVTAFVLALLIQQFVIKPFYIPSASMEPTLLVGDRVLVNRFIYRFGSPKIGDVVVFHPPIAPQEDYIKRVMATAGQTIGVHNGKLVRDGKPVNEPYLKEPLMVRDSPDVKVPVGDVFVMGDNRNDSGDSRVFGPVPISSLLGKAFMVYWPLSRIGGL